VFDIRKTFDDNSVEFIIGDMTRIDDLNKACEGIDTVIHCASPAVGLNQHSEELLYAINVLGTQNVIEACIRSRVKQLIYTSSASVVFEGEPLYNADETQPLAAKFLDPYSKTKAEAEKYVLQANGRKGLLTVSLRPSGLFGPRDAQFVPGVLSAAKQGKTRFRIGDGKNKFDFTYIENVADAHLIAADKLTENSPVAGQAYFITNDEPMYFWDMIAYFCREFQLPSPKFGIPYSLALMIAIFLEFLVWFLSLFGIAFAPVFNKFRTVNVGVSRTFSIEKAKKELGYTPKITLEEGKRKTAEWFKKNVDRRA